MKGYYTYVGRRPFPGRNYDVVLMDGTKLKNWSYDDLTWEMDDDDPKNISYYRPAGEEVDESESSLDIVNRPPHYKSHPSGIECIQITEHMNFNIGNAVKYCWRSELKHADPILDLRKAEWYIQREISRLEKMKDVENVSE